MAQFDYDHLERIRAEEDRRDAVRKAERKAFLERLMGSADPVDWQVPAQVQDTAATLRRHVAQLDNAIRYTMGYVINDAVSLQTHALIAGTLTRLVLANVAIARTLAGTAKTVRGVPAPEAPQG